MSLPTNYTTYYDRKMKESLLDSIEESYPWLIKYVKGKDELDFQTGNNPKTKQSWFSVYKGTGRILTISSIRGKVEAADSYKEVAPKDFFKNLTPEGFDVYLNAIDENKLKFGRYYINQAGKKKEGYYQTLIARRYTFNAHQKDDFIIIDKEFVLGFKSSIIKSNWSKSIVDELRNLIVEFRKQYPNILPKDIKTNYGEFDFLGLNCDGDIIIMELKQDDPSKTALSPIQTGFYYRQFKKILSEDKGGDLYKNIEAMVKQKVDLGLITFPVGKKLPKKLSGNIKCCVIVGEDRFSPEIKRRYRLIRNMFLPEMKAYTCDTNGTLCKSCLD